MQGTDSSSNNNNNIKKNLEKIKDDDR